MVFFSVGARSVLGCEYCDGTPYLLDRTVMEKSRIEINAEANEAVGIPDVGSMTVNELKEQL